MSIDVSGFTQAITDGGAAALAVCLAWGVAVWGVRAVKLLTTDTPRYGSASDPGDYEPEDYEDYDEFDHSMDECPSCHALSSWNAWDEGDGVCPECGFRSPGEYDALELEDVTGMGHFYSCDHCGVNSVDDAWLFDGLFDANACPQCGGDMTVEDVA